MKYKNAIWEGRFQPIHKGHVQFIKKILTLADNVWIIVLANETSKSTSISTKLILPSFTHEVDQHHRKEKNPYPLGLRLRMVQQTLRTVLSNDELDRVTIACGHRLDLDPTFYKSQLFPPERVFLTPTRDAYENSKAAFWRAFGETCIRVDVSDFPEVSATRVRRAIENDNQQEIGSLLYPKTIEILKDAGCIQKKSPVMKRVSMWSVDGDDVSSQTGSQSSGHIVAKL